MAQVSKRRIKENVFEKIFTLFFIAIGQRDSQKEFQEVMTDVFSATECIVFAKRIAIIYLRLKRVEFNVICDVLKVSPATVAKFSSLSEKDSGISLAFTKTLKNEKIAEFLEEIFITLSSPGTPGVNWKASWQRKIEHKRRKREGI